MATTAEWSVTVTFFGICTHINPHLDTAAFQVVLVNASDPQRINAHDQLRNRGIQPHEATLQILRRDLVQDPEARPWFPILYEDAERVVWKLDGVFLRIANAISTVDGARIPPACVPHLALYCATLPPPRGNDAENATDTACIFEYPGSLYAGRSYNPNANPDGGSSVGVITVATAAPPEIRVVSFAGGEVTFPVRPDAAISLANIPKDIEDEQDADFLLHFLALSRIPDEARFPGENRDNDPFRPCPEPVSPKNLPIHIGGISTPGCSNSNYP